MNKHSYIFFTLWFYLISSFLLILTGLFLSLFAFYYLITEFSDQTNPKIFVFSLFLICTIFLLYILGKKNIQWVKINNEYITANCLWGTLKKCKWSDIKEINIDSLPVSHPNAFSTRWIVFDDGKGENTIIHNGLLAKDNCIKIKYSKRALRVIKMYWTNGIKNR